MATPRRRSSRIKGETPVSEHRCQLSGHDFAFSLHLSHDLGMQADWAIVSPKYALSKQAILFTRARRVSCKRCLTLHQRFSLLTPRPSKYRYGANYFHFSAIASQNTSDGFARTANYGGNAPKQSPPEYYQAIGISSRLWEYLFSDDWLSFKDHPHSSLPADTIEIE